MKKTISDYLHGLEEKDAEIADLKSEVKKLREVNSKLTLNAIKEMKRQIPEIEETFRSWLVTTDGRDLYEEAMNEIEEDYEGEYV